MSEKKAFANEAAETITLCAASAYTEKYYLNPLFSKLPEGIRNELKIMCVLYTKEIGGIFLMEFDEDGSLQIRTEAKENDYAYDEVGSVLMIKEIQKSKEELLRSIELFYKVVILGEPLEQN
ncbi:MAG: DUF6145 family protein [Lachnospiraceae bacterium]|nr:DUF6145 family protein [Lachnospiraceae bacterium]